MSPQSGRCPEPDSPKDTSPGNALGPRGPHFHHSPERMILIGRALAHFGGSQTSSLGHTIFDRQRQWWPVQN